MKKLLSLIAVLGICAAALVLTGCHHFGGGWCGAPVSAPTTATTVSGSTSPTATSLPNTTLAQPDAPVHRH